MRPMDWVGRFFLCAGCRAQTLVCSHCDRGQIYCSTECAQAARRHSVREAGRRYQVSRRGRHAHAERARHLRARRNKVTHQGSPSAVVDDLLPVSLAVVTPVPGSSTPVEEFSRWRCCFCGVQCSEFIRSGFQRRRQASRRAILRRQRGGKVGHSPSNQCAVVGFAISL